MKTRDKNKSAFANKSTLGRAIKDAFIKLNPRTQIHNPVMFIVYICAILTTLLYLISLFGIKDTNSSFILAITIILWFTSLFANFAEEL